MLHKAFICKLGVVSTYFGAMYADVTKHAKELVKRQIAIDLVWQSGTANVAFCQTVSIKANHPMQTTLSCAGIVQQIGPKASTLPWMMLNQQCCQAFCIILHCAVTDLKTSSLNSKIEYVGGSLQLDVKSHCIKMTAVTRQKQVVEISVSSNLLCNCAAISIPVKDRHCKLPEPS